MLKQKKTKVAVMDLSDSTLIKPAKKSFSPEAKESALAMLASGSTLKQTAAHIGCSVASLQQWKANAKKAKRKPGKKAKQGTDHSAVSAPTVHASTIHASYDNFIREYWCGDGSDVLTSSPLSGFDLFFRINDALEYAYKYFNK